jgi:hypothetical protein
MCGILSSVKSSNDLHGFSQDITEGTTDESGQEFTGQGFTQGFGLIVQP